MRIRKRQLALCSIPTATATATAPSPLPDLHLRRSEAPPPDQNTRWAEEKLMMKPKQFADDHDNTNNDIRKIVNICGGGGGLNTNYILQSKIEPDVDYKLVPLKKRKGINFETNHDHDPNPKTNNKSCAKKSKRGNVIMEGSRCSRVNGRGWRCCHPTLVGYSLCDHHLGKGKKIRTKVAMVKARSINTLICSPKFD